MQSQLVQSEKMSSLGLLVAGLAHEINNSINAVYNGIQPLSLAAERLARMIEGVMPRSKPPVRLASATKSSGIFAASLRWPA